MTKHALRIVRFFSVITVVLCILFYVGARIVSPLVPFYGENIQNWVSNSLQRPVNICSMSIIWQGLWPRLSLHDISLLDEQGSQTVIRFSKVTTKPNILESLRQMRPILTDLELTGIKLKVQRDESGKILLQGFQGVHVTESEDFKQWLLAQTQVSIVQGEIIWQDDLLSKPAIPLRQVNLTLKNKDQHHQLVASVKLPERLGDTLAINADITGNLLSSEWQGVTEVNASQLNFAQWLPQQHIKVDGRLDFHLHSTWQKSHILTAAGRFDANQVVLTKNRLTTFTLDNLAGQIKWQLSSTGWQLDIAQLQIVRDGWLWPQAGLQVSYLNSGKGEKPEWQFHVGFLDIADVSSMLLALPNIPSHLQQQLLNLKPKGVIRDLKLAYQRYKPLANRLSGHFDFTDVSTSEWQTFPGIKNLAGRVEFSGHNGTLNIYQISSLVLSDWFQSPLLFKQLNGKVQWYQHADMWQVDVGLHSQTSAWQMLAADLSLLVSATGIHDLDLQANLEHAQLQSLLPYIPMKRLKPALANWLGHALKSGQVEKGTLVLQGAPQDFPFEKPDQGLFQLDLQIADTQFNYKQGYPPLKGAKGNVKFRGKQLIAKISKGRIQGYHLQQAVIRIDDLQQRHLKIKGQLQGDLRAGHQFLLNGPLASVTAKYAQNMRWVGQHQLNLDLFLPLQKTSIKPIINIDVKLKNNQLDIIDIANLTAVTGNIHFNNQHGLSAKQVSAEYLGYPIQMEVIPKDEAVKQRVRISGKMELTKLLKYYQQPFWLPYLQGETEWQANIALLPAGQMRLYLSSQLKGVTSSLPWPLSKVSDENLPLTLEMALLSPTEKFRFELGSRVKGNLAWSKQHKKQLECGYIHFGSSSLAPCDKTVGVKVTGSLSTLSVAEWFPIITSLYPSKQQVLAQSLAKQINLHIGKLDIGYLLKDISITANQLDWAWLVNVLSPQIGGIISFPINKADAPVKADLDYLTILTSTTKPINEFPLNLQQLPALELRVKQLRINQLELGKMNLQTAKSPQGFVVNSEVIANDFSFLFEGEWLSGLATQMSKFYMEFKSSSLAVLLKLLGKKQQVAQGKVSLKGNFTWPGAPYQFALSRAEGEFDADIGQGRILNVEPGLARILGILNVGALPRRLDLDFSDLLKQGLVFDSIKGRFTCIKGICKTTNLNLLGPNVAVKVHGQSNIMNGEHQQMVTVIPNVTAGLPMVGAIAGGPAGAASLLILQKILGAELNKVSQIKYSVQGNGDNLDIKRIKTVRK